jgi:hypothetical protein
MGRKHRVGQHVERVMGWERLGLEHIDSGGARMLGGSQPRTRSGQLLAAIVPPYAAEHQPRRAASIVAMSIFVMSIIASNARLA